MAANGRLIWCPAGVKGLRVTGWENKIKNMPEEATSDWTTLNVYILDDIDPAAGDGAQGNAAQMRHAQWCTNMRDTFNDTVADCRVKSIRMQNGQHSRHLLQHIEGELRKKTEDDLVVFCFHGTAGGDGVGYNFNLTGPGPTKVNAHKLITKANESSADVLFILDCFFPTKSITQWKRDDHMTEIILAGREMHDVNGRPIAGPGNFDEGFADAMRDILANPRGEARQTIPRIMGRDKSLCCTPQRYWLHRPDRSHPEIRVWRFFFDIGRLKSGDGERLELRRCKVTGRRAGEFGGDPNLDYDGWGSDGGSDGGGSDGGRDDDDDDDENNNNDDDEARHDGGEDDGDGDGDSSNGGWGRGFCRTCRRTPSGRANAEDEDGAGAQDDDEGTGNGDSVAKQWAQLRVSLGLPSKFSDEEAIYLVKRLQRLPKQLKRRQQLPTPSSSGVRKRAKEKRPISADAEARGRSEVATRPRRASSVTSDCQITSVRLFGHELGRPIDPSEATETIETSAPPSARRNRLISWLQDPFKEEEDDDKAFIKRSDSPAPRAGGDDTGAALRDFSMESDLEVTFEGPVNRPCGRGDLIDLTDLPADLTGELDSLFIPEQTVRDGGHKTAGFKKKSQTSLFSFN